MKCSHCNSEIESCDSCNEAFDVGDTILCLDGDVHLCDDRCFLDFAKEMNDINKANVEED